MATFLPPAGCATRAHTLNHHWRAATLPRKKTSPPPPLARSPFRQTPLCTTHPSNPPRPAPRSVRDARVVVVGGGPVGTVAATMLWLHGVSDVTLVERGSGGAEAEAGRSWGVSVYPRGIDALRVVPGLDEAIVDQGAQLVNLVRVTKHGAVKLFPFPPPLTTVQYFLVHDLRDRLAHFMRQRTRVHARYRATVAAVRCTADGIELDVESDGRVETLAADLVIGADGRESTVVSALRGARSSSVKSRRGFGVREQNSASVGLKVKSLLLNPDQLRQSGVADEHLSNSIISFDSALSDKPVTERVKLRTFPTRAQVVESCGGLVGAIVNRADSEVWAVRTAEELYALLERNFPSLNVRKLVLPAAADAFVAADAATFPPVGRVDSLTGRVGSAGVVIVGDAAHSFPPDTGLGLSSGLEDVARLAASFAAVGDGATIHDVLDDYDARGEGETDALVYIARVAAPFQHGNAPVRRFIHSTYGIVRSLLAQQFPALFALPLNMQALGLTPYSEMVRRDRQTARLVFILAAAALAAGVYYAYDQIDTYEPWILNH